MLALLPPIIPAIGSPASYHRHPYFLQLNPDLMQPNLIQPDLMQPNLMEPDLPYSTNMTYEFKAAY